MHKVVELLIEALSEDARADHEHGFEADGFFAFFPEEQPNNVEKAWLTYLAVRSSDTSLEDVIRHYAATS